MHECPKCKSEDIHRSHVRSKWENWRKQITLRRPFRCHSCGWRGWGVDTGPKFRAEEIKLATRALALDRARLRHEGVANDEPSPEDVDLRALDRPEVGHPIGTSRPTSHGPGTSRRLRERAVAGPRS